MEASKESTNEAGYQSFSLGAFTFARDEYFVHITWPSGSHMLPADRFLEALLRDVAWSFFYGIVNFDEVFGTVNHYGSVDVFAGSFNSSYRHSGRDHSERFNSNRAREVFEALLEDWTNDGFDPFAAPAETGSAFGPKGRSNSAAVKRQRVTAKRMAGAADDIPLRTDANGYAVNRHFADVAQDEPEIHAEPSFEREVHAFNLFAYLSRSDVTWNPSVCSVVKDSLFCPTTEEYMLPVIHGNDRVEWFIQLTDEIHWEIADRDTGEPRARVVMKAGDVAAMPADIRHQGMSPKRSMLLVWENADPALPELYASKKLKPNPIDF
jgi:Hydroquinone 1,2-dioxygenase large subunit N-terminal